MTFEANDTAVATTKYTINSFNINKIVCIVVESFIYESRMGGGREAMDLDFSLQLFFSSYPMSNLFS